MIDTSFMAKQRKLVDQPYAERMERSFMRWPSENLIGGSPDAPTLGRLVDPSGKMWALRRSLTHSAARKLSVIADEMIIGDGGFDSVIDERDRESIWASVEKHGRLPDEEPDPHLEYAPYEFDSEGGLILLYLQRRC